jgi:HAD superfamily hydrolase (TIGR01459 family)
MTAAPPILASAAELLSQYDVLLCDVWGVVHDGRTAYPGANSALSRFRAKGGTVILVSNAPMTAPAVAELLDDKGVSREAWDGIVPSGDIALNHIAAQGYKRVFGIGARVRDASFFDAVPRLVDDLAEADAVACTGLANDRTEKPEQYIPVLEQAMQRRLPFVCVNPDLAVHVGHDLLPCAGAIATLYEQMGGKVFWGGKPHPIAYATGLQMAAKLRGHSTATARVLGIGDAVRTDVKAAAVAGVDSLFIAAGLHRDELYKNGKLDASSCAKLFAAHSAMPKAVMDKLIW